jgi:hypothetical protein
LALAFSLQPLFPASAATTITTTNRFAYGANIGWIDACADTNNGAVIGEYVCSGFLYAANVGWISLGSGAPVNRIQYQNNSGSDFGVNHDGAGNLRGYAYGANIGWVNFETNGVPSVDLSTGNLSGYAWSANCGWIALANSAAFAQTASMRPAPLASNRLPMAWLLENFSTTAVQASADPDGDGMSTAQEYWAGTDPNDPASALRITQITRDVPRPGYTRLRWNSVPTRLYAVELCDDLAIGHWYELMAWRWPGADNVGWDDHGTRRFCRIRAFRPLME